MIKKLSVGLLAGLLVVLGMVVSPVEANHSWGGYHWARVSNPFTLVVADNVNSAWDSYLGTTVSDWSESSVLDMRIVAGVNNPKRCKPTSGRVEVCNSTYGNNGWLGIAQIWISGGHITAGVTKLNDSYFNKPSYNSAAWRNLVACQEVGHTLGLDHQDENFSNANMDTCMDYTNNPESNQHPNSHDYEELEAIYGHLDSTTTVGLSQTTNRGMEVNHDNPSEWGRLVRETKGGAVYERDFGNGQKMLTHVLFAL